MIVSSIMVHTWLIHVVARFFTNIITNFWTMSNHFLTRETKKDLTEGTLHIHTSFPDGFLMACKHNNTHNIDIYPWNISISLYDIAISCNNDLMLNRLYTFFRDRNKTSKNKWPCFCVAWYSWQAEEPEMSYFHFLFSFTDSSSRSIHVWIRYEGGGGGGMRDFTGDQVNVRQVTETELLFKYLFPLIAYSSNK